MQNTFDDLTVNGESIMKKQRARAFFTFGAVLLMSFTIFIGQAYAVLINGSIGFGANYVARNAGGVAVSNLLNATQITDVFAAVMSATGDFSDIKPLTPVDFYNDFSFNPSSVPIAPLWQITLTPENPLDPDKVFSFSLTSLQIKTQIADQIGLSGMGTLNITGFGPTEGYWSFTANKSGASFTFSDSVASVPEPSTLLLLGCGLFGVGLVRKRY